MAEYFVPLIGRAGLGNELFPVMAALEASHISANGRFVRPNWLKLRLGPYLRNETDKREYWRLFKGQRLVDVAISSLAVMMSGRAGSQPSDSRIHIFRGMAGYFDRFTNGGQWHREQLEMLARPGVVTPSSGAPFVGFHVRLGDFVAPTAGQMTLTANNMSTPIAWFRTMALAVREKYPDLPIIVASDGSDIQLAPLLSVSGTARSNSLNALDEIIGLSRAAAIVGSRSTFTAWAAFLGSAPLLTAPGGNAYFPHPTVWEAVDDADASAWIEALGDAL